MGINQVINWSGLLLQSVAQICRLAVVGRRMWAISGLCSVACDCLRLADLDVRKLG